MLKRINLPLVLLLCLLALVLGYKLPYWFLHPLSISPDQSVYLEMAQLILQGKTPYLDFFDFNPPLIMYLSVIPVLVSRLMQLPVPFGFNLFILGLHILVTIFCGWLIYSYRTIYKPLLFVPVLLAFAAFTPGLVSDLGQREHIFTLLFMPFLMVRGLTYSGKSPGQFSLLVSGLLAGLGLSLKPQFVFIWLLGELGFYLKGRSLKPLLSLEIKACLLVPLVYGLCFLLLPGGARDIYFNDAVPVYLYGSSWNSRCIMHMLCGFEYFAEPFTQILLALFLAPFIRTSAFCAPLVLLLSGSLAGYFSGMQAWTYRLLPATLFAQLLLAYQFGHLLQFLQTRFRRLGLSVYRFDFGVCASAVLIACGLTSFYVCQFYGQWQAEPRFDLTRLGLVAQEPRSDFDGMFFAITANCEPGEAVVHVGSGIRPGYPSQLQSLNPPGSRYLYSYLVMFASAMSNKPEYMERFRAQQSKMVEELGSDILKNHPRLVFVQQLLIEEMLEPYQFKQKYLAHYREAGFVEGCKIYKLE